MGGLTFGGGYFGQYSQGGTTPPDNPATADVFVLVMDLVATVAVNDLVATVIVPELTTEVE